MLTEVGSPILVMPSSLHSHKDSKTVQSPRINLFLALKLAHTLSFYSEHQAGPLLLLDFPWHTETKWTCEAGRV